MALGEKIRKLRKKRGLKVEEVAVAAGITVGHLYRIERGESQNPKLDVIKGLAKALGVELLELTG